MKRFLTGITLFAALSITASAATFSALAVTGYNYGGIVPNTAVPPYSSVASSLDTSNDALFQIGLPGATAGGLPVSGVLSFTVNSNSYSFTLGPAGSNNLLRVNPSGTMTLTTPAKFAALAVLGFTTGNNSPGAIEMVGDATVHFSDSSSSVYSGSVDLSDWFAATPQNPNVVTSAVGGTVNITSGTAAGAFQATANGPKFYVSVITLTAADAAKTVTSVGFGNFPFGGNSYQFIMGLDGETAPPPPVTPVPPAWVLAALAMIAIVAVRAALRRPPVGRKTALHHRGISPSAQRAVGFYS
jgi:hypothetical protein